MAMRITTKMIQNTSIRNLAINKYRQEKLTYQMATGKKITRPSDDPVTAIRALKLNSSLDKIDQYYERNAEDAVSWLDLTDKAIDTAVKIISDQTGMSYKLNQIANTYLEYSDKLVIAKELVSFAEEFYSVGNADSAGRSLFTGYRTDLPLVYKEPKSETSAITEQRTKLDMDKITYVASGCLRELNEGNFNEKDATDKYVMNTTEYDVTMHDIYRFRLAYSDTDAAKKVQEVDAKGDPVFADDGKGNMTIPVYKKDAKGNDIYEPNVKLEFGNFSGLLGTTIYSANTLYDEKGKEVPSKPITCFENATEEAYMKAVNDPDAVVYIASTGELLLGNNVKQQISGLQSETEIRLSYEKTEWKKNDIDPIHYFYTERKHPTQDRMIVYNENFLKDATPSGKQIIEYDIGNNQTIRVNTTADELFTHDLGRDVNELQQMITEEGIMLTNLKKIEDIIASGKVVDPDDLAQLELQKKALAKAKESLTDTVKKRSGELIARFKGYLEQVNVASTNCGARGARIELIKNRLGTQQENYEELVSKNEDADYSELTVQLASIKTTYDAALASISYVMQTSLLDYIR